MPIVRRERAVGVLAVQHADPRRYDDVEIEALQTVAMVLAELIANAGLIDERARPRRATREAGAGAARRPEAGRRHGARPRRLSTSRASMIEHTVAEDIEAERHRVYSAFRKMREQIDAMTSQAEFGVGRRASGRARDLQDVRL